MKNHRFGLRFLRSKAPRPQSAALAGLLVAGLALSGCNKGTTTTGTSTPADVSRNADVVALHQGRLADVFGFVIRGGVKTTELFRKDVLVGPDIQDERPSGSTESDEAILYDFISVNPDTLQPRLLITRNIGSAEFDDAFAKLDDACRIVAPLEFGADTRVQPYSVVPRNAAIRVTFRSDLGIDDSFFYERDANGTVTAVRNREAIQLLQIAGDPTDNEPQGDFEVIPSRYIVRGNQIILDPVLLGSEGLQFGAKNQASGLPEAPDQRGANIRLAIALEGPLRITGVRSRAVGGITGTNNSGVSAVVRDFRSGNKADNSADIARGFVRDPLPPRVLGQMRMILGRVDDAGDPVNKVLRVFKNGIKHAVDAGDVLRLVDPEIGEVVATVDVLRTQGDDGTPDKADSPYVNIVVRRFEAGGVDVLERLDPANKPGYDDAVKNNTLDAFLRANGPLSVLLAEFSAGRDDPSFFINFNPTPIQEAGSSALPNQDVSPFAGAIIRFTKPVDMATVRALDSMFIATRDVLSKDAITKFLSDANMSEGLVDDARFLAKFRTPHLVFSRVFDEDGSQTAIRIQPTLGLYLDKKMRDEIEAAKKDPNKTFADWPFKYYVHLLGGGQGVRDLSGNPLDFQSTIGALDSLVMPFSLDTRTLEGTTRPRFGDNQVVYVVRRFATDDEDERPSLYIPTERPAANGQLPEGAFPRRDIFGAVTYLSSGELQARTAGRVRKVVDNLNQLPAPPQISPLRWCPISAGETQITAPTATVVFGGPLQNPLNPFGCRLQAVWREIDLSLSRTDADDFNLDVERFYWAPYTRAAVTFDEFDQISLYLGHSEYRPEPCIGQGSAFPRMTQSGVRGNFAENYANNRRLGGAIDFQPPPHPAFQDKVLTINAKEAITEQNGVNRYLPMPLHEDATKDGFTNPLFIYRDETIQVQGGVNGLQPSIMNPYPYIISPFLGGRGKYVSIDGNGAITFNNGGWYNGNNTRLPTGGLDSTTGGLVGPVALPLLADFWVMPDSADLPEEDPFRASGANGWQVSLGTTASPRPNFRAYSGGFSGGSSGNPILVSPSDQRRWSTATGGFTPNGGIVPGLDNTVYWIMADFLKRTTVATSGYVDIMNPHRVPANFYNTDPRLGPWTGQVPTGALPDYAFDFEPALETLPAGTKVIPEFSATGPVDSGPGYPWPELRIPANLTTNADNFPLDPLKAGDAWVKHFDERTIGGTTRRSFTYMYNRNVTSYTRDITNLSKTAFTNQFGGPNESFEARDVRYFNWRLIMRNNVQADPPVSPKIESFSVSYRFLVRR